MRQKEFGIWREWTWDATAHGGARDRRRPARARLRSRRLRLDPVEHRRRMGARRSGGAVVRRRLERHLPDRRRGAGRTTCAKTRAPRSCSSRTTSSSTRRSRCARGCRCCAGSSSSTWKACASFHDQQVISLDALARARPRPRRAAPGCARRARGRLPPAGPGDPRLHVGHDRQAEGRDALARAASSTRCAATTRSSRRTSATSACASCRCATSPSASAASTSPSTPARVLNFVENPETVPENVREIAPTVLHRRAARLGEVLLGVTIAIRESGRVQQAGLRWAIGVGRQVADRVIAGQPVGAALQPALPAWRAGWRWTTCAS